VTQPDPDAGSPLLAASTAYTYDLAGNVLSQTDGLGHATTFEYDDLFRLLSQTEVDSVNW